MRLRLLPGLHTVARLAPDAAFPAWADGPGFVSLTRTATELSVVCPQNRVPSDVTQDRGWRALALDGPVAFSETGVVLSLVRPLSENGLGVFVVSTFDGDHLLVKADSLEAARSHLAQAGHTIALDAPPPLDPSSPA